VHQHYNFINTASFALEVLKSARKNKQQLSSAQLREEVEVTCSMPGQPEEETLHRLYMEGFLKYDAYLQYISCKHSIPLSMFETKPALDLKDLHGIQDPPPADGPPKKKQKS
jgi:hypothetical protein